MSPHTDAGALLKLADDCALYAKVIEGIIVVENDYQPGDVERREPRETLLKAEAFLRQAASHGRAGGEPALRAALQEIDEIGRKITDLKNEHGIRMGNIAHAALLGAGTAAQAVPDPIRAALIGINGAIDDYWNDATDSNIKLICYWQFKSREALAEPSAHRGSEA